MMIKDDDDDDYIKQKFTIFLKHAPLNIDTLNSLNDEKQENLSSVVWKGVLEKNCLIYIFMFN